MQARFYLPMYHRFGSPDPGLDQHFQETQSWNIYSYVRNSPVMHIDPDGMAMGAPWGGFWFQHSGSRSAEVAAIKDAGNRAADNVQKKLDYAGMTPIIGDGVDAVNGSIYLARGKKADASFAFLGIAAPVGLNVGLKQAGKLVEKVEWAFYLKHLATSKIPWKAVVESTTSGPAKYLPGTKVESIERLVWSEGTKVEGKSQKVMEFANEIGASEGKSSRWVLVKESGNTIHGQPISENAFKKLTEKK